MPPSLEQLQQPTSTITQPSMASTTATSPAAAALRAAKRAMRKKMGASLAALPRQSVVEQSRLVTQCILASPTYRAAQSISIYVSMEQGEVDTDELCRHALDAGKRLYVPLFAVPQAVSSTLPSSSAQAGTTFSTDMSMLRLRSVVDYEAMATNRWGIREPEVYDLEETPVNGAAKEREGRRKREDALDHATGGDGLELILAPGVAFDSFGGRLGHGKGYYDGYISRADAWAAERGRRGPVTVALALREQILPNQERVPADENDKVLDAIITPDGCLGDDEGKGRWRKG